MVARRGTEHMAEVGRVGQRRLDAYIAGQYGISADLDPREWAARMDAARRAYFTRLAEARWGREE